MQRLVLALVWALAGALMWASVPAVAVADTAHGTAVSPAGSAGPRFLRPTTSITPAKGCVRLRPGFNGVKVAMVQRRLGMGSRWETMDADTIQRVKQFQRRHGLHRRDGVVDRRTWRAMDFEQGFCFDRWQAEPAHGLKAGPKRRIRTMIKFANGYRGSEYVWGGAGRPRFGVDCSGLVLQALYRAGLDPQPVTIDKHVRPHYRTSYNLYTHDQLRHVRRARMRRGDLIFYTDDSTGRINHVAIYLGRGRMLQAKGSRVHAADVRRHYPDQTIARTVVRPFR